MMKLNEIVENSENMLKTLDMAKEALRNGLGPAHNSDKTFVAFPGKMENKVYYVIIVEKGENGNMSKPVDWYAWSPKSDFVSGFGSWYKYDCYEFIKANSWVEYELPNLTKKIKAARVSENISN